MSVEPDDALNNLVDNDSNDDDDNGDLLSAILSNIFLFFLIFGLSATVEIKNMRKQLTNKFAIGCGVAMQFFIMPVLGYLSVIALRNHGMSEAMGITLLVVTSSPGGSYSNWWCSTFNAELALSVAMTTVSSLMSIGMLPANLLFYSWLAYGSNEEESVIEALDFGTLFISLGVVMSAIVLGLTCGYFWDNARFHEISNRLGSISGLCLILFGLLLSSGGGDNGEDTTSFWEHPWAFYIGVTFPCLIGISLANIISRSLKLSPQETVAISIECCYQNTGIATSVAITMFDDAEERAQAVAVPLLYGIVEAVVIGLYCVWAWKVGWTKAPPDEKICTVITKSYEIVREEDSEDNGEGPKRGTDEEVGQQNQMSSVQHRETDDMSEPKSGGKKIYAELSRLFNEDEADPPVSAADQSVELDVDPVTGEVNTRFTTPPSKDSRRRITSDYTAETLPSNTPSPHGSRQEGEEFGEKLAI